MSLGKYLMNKCFNDAVFDDVVQYVRCYTHDEGKVSLSVERVPTFGCVDDETILVWNFCKLCNRVVTPIVPLNTGSYNYSFGKFLEMTFYNHTLLCRTGGCSHAVHRDHIRCFAYKNIVAKFEYTSIPVYQVAVPDNTVEYSPTTQRNLFNKFADNVQDACLKLCNELLGALSEAQLTAKAEAEVIRVTEILEDVKKQRDALWEEFDKCKHACSIFGLNQFLRYG